MTDPNSPSFGTPESSPSWLMPIAVGALITMAGMALMGALGAHPAGGLLCCAMFLPFGFVPVWLANRRNRSIGAGQGFAIAFISVGLGAVIWTAITIAGDMSPEVDLEPVREAMIEQREQAPEDQRMTDEQIDQTIEAMAAVIPYLPAIVAVVMTLLASIVGLISGAILYRRPAQE